jgi:ABC-type dipeptide/oligopeptide/nickel transport system permease subunit
MLGAVSVEAMALIIAALAWMWPARAVRAQVLTIRERMYAQVARFKGASNLRIIIGELLPNLVPYLAATLVGAISGAILASVGLSTLGLGPMTMPYSTRFSRHTFLAGLGTSTALFIAACGCCGSCNPTEHPRALGR